LDAVEFIDTLLLQSLVGDFIGMPLESELAICGFDGSCGSLFGKT
jgi:hypothetical protein